MLYHLPRDGGDTGDIQRCAIQIDTPLLDQRVEYEPGSQGVFLVAGWKGGDDGCRAGDSHDETNEQSISMKKGKGGDSCSSYTLYPPATEKVNGTSPSRKLDYWVRLKVS